MDELKKLYNTLVLKGRYNKSFDEFQSEWQNADYQNQVYDDVSKLRLYTKSRDTFMRKYAGSTPAPTAAETEAPATAVQEEAVVEQPKKKEDTTALPSGLGSSVSSVSAEADPEALRFGKLASSLKDQFKPKVPESYATSSQFQKDLQEAPIKKAKEEEEFAQSQLKAANEFEALGEKPKVEQSKFLNEQLEQINSDLIGKSEEFVVPEMEYRFGKLGFKFEEAKAGRDYMDVTAPNGKATQISLDNFLSSTSASEALKLQKFIQENTPIKGLFVLEKTLREQDKTFNSKKEVDDEAARINQEATVINQKQKDFLLKKDAYEKEVDALNSTPESQWSTPEFIKRVDELEKIRVSLSDEIPTLIAEEETLTKKASMLDKAVGKYVTAKAKQGTLLDGIKESILAGFGSMLADAQGRFIDITTEILPTGMGMGEDFGRQIAVAKADKIGAASPEVGQSMDDWKDSLTEKQLDAWEDEVDDAKKKFLKKGLQPAAREGLSQLSEYVLDRNTSPEWMNLTKEGFWGGAILGLAQSLPAMIGRGNPMGWVQRTSQMYAQVSDGLMQEMENDPAFADISESEKAAIIAPIGVTSSILEAYGLRNILQSKGIITSITMAALGKAGRGVGSKSFRELVENEVTNRIARGALVLTAAGLAEGETGAAQELTETGFKALYNVLKEKELFQTPESIKELATDVLIAGGQEMVGGFVLGIPTAVASAYSKKGFLKMDDKSFEMFESMANDGSLQSAYIISLKEKIASGKISPSDAKEELQNYRTAVGVYRQLPDGLDTEQKKEAMNLLKERKDLEQYIQGKDTALVTPQKNRINEINQELSKIAEQGQARIDAETNDVSAQRAAKMAELSKAIEDDDTATELNLSTKLPTEERQRIEKELQDLKAEEDAIQKQAAGQVPVQPTAGVGQEVEQGVSQAEPKGVTEAGVQEEVTPTTELTTVKDDADYVGNTLGVNEDDATVISLIHNSELTTTEKNILFRQWKRGVMSLNDIKRLTVLDLDEINKGNIDKWANVILSRNRGREITAEDISFEEVPTTQEGQAKEEVTAQPTLLTEAEQIAKMEEMFTQEEAPVTPTEPTATLGVNVSDPIGMDSLRNRVQDNAKKQVIDFAQKTLTTLKSVLPDFEIVVHDDENSYRNALPVGGNAQSAGYFSYAQRPDGTYVGKIDINLNVANKATVAHEVAHGVMRKTFGENTEAFKTLKNRIAAVLNQEGNQALTDFVSQYEENDSYEEYLVELAAQLTQSDKNISPTLLQNIASIINDVVSKITNGAFTPFQNVKDTKQTIEFLRNISESIRKGEAINPADITAIQEGLSVPIGSPTTINPLPKGKASLNFPKAPLPLSFVTEADKIDINALIDDIVAKKQKIWFWMADQLGRGNYYDEVIEGEHYLDAGPSFALDPANRSKGILWASGLPEKTLTNQINQADYIFFISGSPEKAKLFNKRVLDLLAERVNKTSDFNKFREAINNFDKETVELRTIREALNEVNSFKELADSPKRKPFLIALGNIGALKTTPKGSLKELLGSFNAFIDYNDLRDGFYKENGFGQNDIMLVGKPTAVAGKAPHSTYEFAISGEVVGVPDKKIDSWNIMPESIKEKYKDVIGGREEKTKPMQTKVIAAETGVIRELEPRMKGKAQLIGKNARLSAVVKRKLLEAEAMDKNNISPQLIRETTGWEKGKEGKWRYEIPDGKFKNVDLDDLKKTTDENGKEVREAILGDIFDTPELFDSYPEAKKITVHFKKLKDEDLGIYTRDDNRITINLDLYNSNKNEAELTMLHEIQHYIQNRELFEAGSNPKYAKAMMDFIVSYAKDLPNKAKSDIDLYKKYVSPIRKEELKKLTDSYKYALSVYKKIVDLSKEKFTKEQEEYIRKVISANESRKGREVNDKILEDVFKKLSKKAVGFNLYQRVSGEVEARNVEVRNKLTPEQRRKILLSETEDFKREDQIMFDNFLSMLNVEVKGKAQLSGDAKAINVVKQARAQGFSENAIRQFLQSKGFSEEAINKAMATDIPAAGKVTLSEETISGYDSLIKKLENLAKKGMPLAEVISKLKNSKTYIDATDVQKEKLVREVRKMFKAREKSAPKAGKLIGIINDITKITMTEKEILNKRLKELNEGAKDAVKAWRKTTADLAKEIKQLASSGKLTAKQVTRVTTRLLNINAFNEKSVKDFIDYMANVFANAEYRDKIDTVKSKISKAKKNIESKIGIANTLKGNLNKLLSINPILIPDAYLDRYVELVEMLGASQQVLNLEEYDVVKSDTDAILRAVNEEQSLAYELGDLLENSENKIYTKQGELDYAATIREMVKRGEITEDDADVMRKYKKEILPQGEKQTMSKEELEEQKNKEAINIINSEFDSNQLPSREERDFADKFINLIRNISIKDLMKLSLNDLKNLSKVIKNINNNYLPSYAYQMYQKLDGIQDAVVLDSAASKASPPIFSTSIAKIKDLFTKEGALYEAIKRIPLINIDQVLGNFKGKEVFNALLLKTAQAEAKFKTELKRINSALEKAEQKVASSFSLDENKLALSKMKMMTYMRQLEYESNEGSRQVNPAIEYINKTIEHIEKSRAGKRYGKRDLDNLKRIKEMYEENGQINLKNLYESFNQAEKDAINDIQKINESLRSKAEFTANVIRGQVFNGLENYLHLIVLGNNKNSDINAATDVVNSRNTNMSPSTRAKSLEERTPEAKPINFDIFASASRGAKYVLLDYNLTGPIKTARTALNQLEKTLDERKDVTKLQREVSNSLNKAYNEAVDNLLINNIMDDTFADQFVNYISRMGYRSVLAGTGRFAAELTSNISFALLAEPQSFMLGTTYANIIMSPIGPSVLENVNSTQSNRIYPEDSLSGNFIDTSAMGQRVGDKTKAKSKVVNKIQQLWNLTGKRYTNGVELLADNLISTPDKIVMRTLWFGVFANEFKKISGKDVDFKLIGENNEIYLTENKEAIDKARERADVTSVQAGATDNSFMGILKGVARPNQSALTKAYNNFNSYMTRFLIFEYMSARTGVYAMMGDGPISRTKGAMLLAAVGTRMTVYTMLSKVLSDGILGLAAPLFGIEDEEEEEEKTFLQSLGQAITGSFSSLFFGRDFGNAAKLAINYGLEMFNQEYLDFLRDGEYDQYEDAIVYSIIPRSKEEKQTLDDILFRLGGSFSPALQTGKLIGENLLSGSIQAVLSGDTTKKEADAIERERRVVTQRIPVEVLGNLGFIPLYKDVKKLVNKSIYADLRNKKAKTKDPIALKEKFDKIKDLNELKRKTRDKDELKAINQKILDIVGSEESKDSIDKQKDALKAKKESLLYESSKGIRYKNESEMKRQNPTLWRKRFGPNSEWGKKTKGQDAVESKLRKIQQTRADKEYKEKIRNK